MTEPTAPAGTTSTLPPPQPAAPPRPRGERWPSGRMRTKISSMRTGLIAATVVLIVVLIFIIQNAHTVSISFLGAHLRLSLAVALLLAAVAGALLMAAAGTARITQLRRIIRRGQRQPRPGK